MADIKIVFMIATLATASILHQSCGSFEMPQVCKNFYSLPGSERERQFPGYPLDQQLEIYHCGMQYRPPKITWAWDIADRGEKIIPELLRRMKSEESQATQAELIFIFRVMSRRGYLRERHDVVDEIREVVSHMGRNRTWAQESLDEIEDNMKKTATE